MDEEHMRKRYWDLKGIFPDANRRDWEGFADPAPIRELVVALLSSTPYGDLSNSLVVGAFQEENPGYSTDLIVDIVTHHLYEMSDQADVPIEGVDVELTTEGGKVNPYWQFTSRRVDQGFTDSLNTDAIITKDMIRGMLFTAAMLFSGTRWYMRAAIEGFANPGEPA